jgi:hypothetical protein
MLTSIVHSQPLDSIGFVFEVVRHGARAPGNDDESGKFQVPTGELTSSGMRQRLLLGKHNRERYIEEYGLLDGQFNPDQFYIQSTPVSRTLQSAYAELLGFFPPKFPSAKVPLSEKHMPALKIRRRDSTVYHNTIENPEYQGNGGFIDALNLVPVYSL